MMMTIIIQRFWHDDQQTLLAPAVRPTIGFKYIQNECACRHAAIFAWGQNQIQKCWFLSVPAGTLKISIIDMLKFYLFLNNMMEFQFKKQGKTKGNNDFPKTLEFQLEFLCFQQIP